MATAMMANDGGRVNSFYRWCDINRIEGFFSARYGNRGEILWITGLMWVFLGIGFMTTHAERFSKPGPGGPLQFLDDSSWGGLMWLVGGALGMFFTFWRVRHDGQDGIGFLGITMPCLLWGACYWWSYLFFVVTRGEAGRPTAYTGGLVFWGMAAILMLVAKRLKDEPFTAGARVLE